MPGMLNRSRFSPLHDTIAASSLSLLLMVVVVVVVVVAIERMMMVYRFDPFEICVPDKVLCLFWLLLFWGL